MESRNRIAKLSLQEIKRLQNQVAGRTKKKLQRISPQPRPELIPLSWSQQRLWFVDQLGGGGPAYHVATAVHLNGSIDRDALREALNGVMRRHEILRTVFRSVGGQPAQVVLAEGVFQLAEHDMRTLDLAVREEAVRGAMERETAMPFDLSSGPLIRAQLLHLGGRESILHLTMHHIISDGWSIGVLVREIAAMYTAFTSGGRPALEPLAIQYADYAVWQRAESPLAFEEHIAYWQTQLRDAPSTLALPIDTPRSEVQDFRGGNVSVHVPAELTAQLHALSQKTDSTLFMVLLAAFGVLLSKLSGQDDVVIGTVTANRGHAEIEPLIGLFVNTLALRLRMSPEQSVSDLISHSKRVVLEAHEHQCVPFEQVVELVKPQRRLAVTPIFQSMFVFQNLPVTRIDLPNVTLSPIGGGLNTAQYDLTLSLHETATGEIAGQLNYASSIFEERTVRRWTDHFGNVLREMVDSVRTVNDISLLSSLEQRRLLDAFNHPVRPHPRTVLVHRMFEEQAAMRSSAAAVRYRDRDYSYAQLNADADRLARTLKSKGATRDRVIALCAARSYEMLVAMLAILKSGAAYLPIDSSAPRVRIEHMLQDSGAIMILADADSAASMPTLELPVIRLDHPNAPSGEATTKSCVQDSQDGSSLAYVIYTSGSTGEPKAVMVEHRQVSSLLDSLRSHYQLSPTDRVLQLINICFDVAAEEILSALTSGATLILEQAALETPDRFYRECVRNEISVVHVPTALWRRLLSSGRSSIPPSIRWFVIGGEPWDRETLKKWFEASPRACLVSEYGPTETTVTATLHNVRPEDRSGLIGKPLHHARIYILDERRRAVAIGQTGEIYIGGHGVARGYLGRSELSAERFTADPFVETGHARMYRTGDLGRWRADGCIEFLGRSDTQVKLRGFRLELSEIEAALAAHPEVGEAVVTVRTAEVGDSQLVAYVACRSNAPTPAAFRAFLSRSLPEHMVPAAFVSVPELPLTATGKLDRAALPTPQASNYSTREYQEPQGETELRLSEIWEELLRVSPIGRNDNFFELGGHSLLLMQLLARVLEEYQVELQLRDAYDAPTLAAFAELVIEKQLAQFDSEDIARVTSELDNLAENDLRALADSMVD